MIEASFKLLKTIFALIGRPHKTKLQLREKRSVVARVRDRRGWDQRDSTKKEKNVTPGRFEAELYYSNGYTNLYIY